MAMRNNKIYVIGHKNPDTDSICSAIAYTYLKNKIDDKEYVAKRAGQINEETQFVLNYFGVEVPGYVNDIGTQVKDIEIRETEGVSREISLKRAWNLMKELNVVTLPITKHGRLEGVITTEDIAEAYMDVRDSKILSTAHTAYKNIVDTLDGSMIYGNINAYYTEGKVLIAAANPDMMENYIEPGDLVILGNRYESQLCAIEMNAGCIVVCEGANVSLTIQKMAQEHNCTIISSPHDTYTVARLINQSMPISYFMSRENLIKFRTDAFTEEIKSVMAKKRYRDFPIEDKKGKYVGMISRRNLLNADKKKIILVDHNEKSQAVDGWENAEILEIIDHHRIGSLETMSPVYFRNHPLGCTATIIYQIFLETGQEIPQNIAGILCAAILSDTLMFRSPTCTAIDRSAAEQLSKIAGIEIEKFAMEMFHAGSNLTNKSPEEIFYQDFKKFTLGDLNIGVGQINSLDAEELNDIKEKLVSYLDKAFQEHGVSIIYFMLTNIITESTEVISVGNGATELLEESFSEKAENETVILPGVVSRKKQFIPALLETINSGNI
ncbi:MAG: putative manganese-dependent inorganic diphosphatase [Lachnospiraceae bacterium]|nr:putative manganese-dependent inorganic diphosphatase [Lachnospiraceae bacterium]